MTAAKPYSFNFIKTRQLIEKKMKKLLLVCAFILGVSAVSFAQDQTAQGGGQGRGRRTPEQMVKRLKEQLTLTDEQVAKVTTIYTAQAKVQDSLRTASNGDRAAMRPAQQALRKATNEKVLAILTPDQATIYKKQLADMAARQQQQNGNGN
jgi:protein CpxP